MSIKITVDVRWLLEVLYEATLKKKANFIGTNKQMRLPYISLHHKLYTLERDI